MKIFKDFGRLFLGGGAFTIRMQTFCAENSEVRNDKKNRNYNAFLIEKKSRCVTLVLKREERTCGFVVILSQAFLLWAGR